MFAQARAYVLMQPQETCRGEKIAVRFTASYEILSLPSFTNERHRFLCRFLVQTSHKSRRARVQVVINFFWRYGESTKCFTVVWNICLVLVVCTYERVGRSRQRDTHIEIGRNKILIQTDEVRSGAGENKPGGVHSRSDKIPPVRGQK